MVQMVNPLAVAGETYGFLDSFRQDRVRRDAGNALAAGNYGQGASALLRGGLIDEGLGIQRLDQQLRADEQQQGRAAQAQSLKTMLGGAQTLRQLPADQRMAAYQGQVRPLLVQMGLDQTPDGQALLARFDASSFSDGELDPFIGTLGGELDKPEWQIVQGRDGRVVAYDRANPQNALTLQEAVREPVRERGPDGIYEQQPDGSWKRVAAFGAAPKVFAPSRAAGGSRGRSGGSGAASQGGSTALPPGFVLD